MRRLFLVAVLWFGVLAAPNAFSQDFGDGRVPSAAEADGGRVPSAAGSTGGGVSFDAAWPVVRGPFSLADRLMNRSTIARSGGVYLLREKLIGVFTPSFDIVSYDASDRGEPLPIGSRIGYFSYALGSGLYEDAAALLFADGLFAPSDTLDYLRGVAAYDAHDFPLAQKCFSLVPEDSPYYTAAKSFTDAYSSAPAVPGYKPRSALLAAGMSALVPGSGKVYAGDLRSGVSTFLITAALGGIAAESWIKLGGRDWRTISLTSIFGLFYIGNIYGSALSVSVVRSTYEYAEKATLLFDLRIPLHQF